MTWITSIVYQQAPGESLFEPPAFNDGPRNIRFRHVVHFYRDVAVPANTDVQQLTFWTIERARAALPEIRVDCVAVTFPEDAGMVPPGWVHAASLDRVITDLATFAHARPLPILFDIVDKGASAPLPDADGEEFYIMTNSDIHLQPGFYRAVTELIARGWDTITINRQTIYAESSAVRSELMFADRGKDHPGFDCFVFPARVLKDFVRSRAACGGGYPMRSIMFNMVAFARRFLMVRYSHLTFHIGDSTYFLEPRFADYLAFNISEAQGIVAELAKDPDKAVRLREFITAHEVDFVAP